MIASIKAKKQSQYIQEAGQAQSALIAQRSQSKLNYFDQPLNKSVVASNDKKEKPAVQSKISKIWK